MRKSLLVLSLLLFGSAPAFAHRYHGHYHDHTPRYVFRCGPWGCDFYRDRYGHPERCVYKPKKDKVICKY